MLVNIIYISNNIKLIYKLTKLYIISYYGKVKLITRFSNII